MAFERVRVIGDDGQTYGPADLATVRTWIGEGRIIASTIIIDEATGQRLAAAQVPGLADALPGPAPAAGAPPTVSRVGYAAPGRQSDKSFLVALLLALLLGGLGIHRFYLGYTGTAVIQLLTCGGCGIWALIDAILIAAGSLKDPNGLPLKD
jgi:hypothetical protein